MPYRPKIFVSCIYKLEKDSPQKRIKTEIIKRLREADFEPQVFLEEGLAEFMPWSFDSVFNLMKKCDGAVILGLSRWSMQTTNGASGIPTEYNHYEGALAAALKLPLLILPEDGLQERGIFYNNGGFIYTSISTSADSNWFNNDEYFVKRFNTWKKAVTNRYQVFLGYCGAAKDTANALSAFLTNRMGLKVKEYRTGFIQGGTILEEIEKASQDCQCGIFLFTADDELAGNDKLASPRDNVLFEAGYFIKAKGKEQVLIIREKGAKMPADIGGNIYLELESRNNISTINSDIEFFLQNRLNL